MERDTVPFAIYADQDDGWRRDVIDLLQHVITADQVLNNSTTLRRDGALARRARELINRARCL